MEDPRLSRMYAKLLSGDLARRRQRAWEWMRERRSSLLAMLAVFALVGFVAAYMAHLHGRFNRLKTELRALGTPQIQMPPMPGGREAVVLQRTSLAEGTMPEFLSATLLPGRGLNVLQIMLSVPGRGTIPLLHSTSLEEAARVMSGTGPDANGSASLNVGAPIEAPWAGYLTGMRGEAANTLFASWRSRSWTLPATGTVGGVLRSEGGLLLKAEADSLQQNVLPDGGTVQGSFIPNTFGDKWPSQVSVSVTALLSSRAFELKLVARNEGGETVPFGLGWSPRILLNGTRSSVRLHLPASSHEEVLDGRVTGRLLPVVGTNLDFTGRPGRLLRDVDLDETFTDLHSGFLDNGPIVEIRDERSGIGIRMTAMSPQIRAIHVGSKANDTDITVGFQTNLDDPLSHAWNSADGASINVLQPGQILQWRLRMEVFATRESDASQL